VVGLYNYIYLFTVISSLYTVWFGYIITWIVEQILVFTMKV